MEMCCLRMRISVRRRGISGTSRVPICRLG
ncbi:hypothetical protein LINGRAHAP2_LOCUS23176 [Linum grandiflorum]